MTGLAAYVLAMCVPTLGYAAGYASGTEITDNSCEQSLTFKPVAQVRQFLDQCADWCFTPQAEADFAGTFSLPDLSHAEKLNKLAEDVIAERVRKLPAISRFFLKKMVADAAKQDSLYSRSLGKLLANLMGPHYNPIFNRAAIPASLLDVNQLAFPIMMIHETEHAIHRNSNPLIWLAALVAAPKEFFMFFKTPFTPIFRRRMEVRAIGAQWELVKRIPKADRLELLARLKQTGNDKSLMWEVADEAAVQAVMLPGDLNSLFELVVEERLASEEDPVQRDEAERRMMRQMLLPQADQTERFQSIARAVLGKIEPVKRGRAKEFLTMGLSRYFRTFNHFPVSGIDAETLDQEKYFRLKRAVTEVKNVDDESITEDALEILIASLENAELSKEEFIEKLAAIHGYTWSALAAKHWKPFTFMRALITVDFMLMLILYDGSVLNAAQNSMAMDIRWLAQLASLFGG